MSIRNQKINTMKVDNLLNATGALVIIIYAVMRILHLGFGEINLSGLITFGLVLSFVGQSWKIKILEKQVRDYQSKS